MRVWALLLCLGLGVAYLTPPMLVPSQVAWRCGASLRCSASNDSSASLPSVPPPLAAPQVTTAPHRRGGGRRKKRKSRAGGGKGQAKGLAHKGDTAQANGVFANAYWRAVPLEDLRLHPLFRALEPASEVFVASAQDVGRFRQDSAQWDALHRGRLTTSKVATCLGFYDAQVAEALWVPPSLRSARKAQRAWQELLAMPLELEELNGGYAPGTAGPAWEQREERAARVWGPPTGDGFARAYLGGRGRVEGHRMSGRNITGAIGAIRLLWGNTQEATSLLTVLNAVQPAFHLEEAGLCALEAVRDAYDPERILGDPVTARHVDLDAMQELWEALELPLPRLGASPDGILRPRDADDAASEGASPAGKLELPRGVIAVELKNHAPFRYRPRQGDFAIRDPGPTKELATWHVPQLQFEMLCCGPQCRHALLLSQSATRGAHPYLMKRNDKYLAHVLRCLSRFYLRHVRTRIPPEPGFAPELYADLDYHHLLELTKNEAQKARLLCRIPQQEIQRGPGEMEDLFCDASM